MSEKGYKKIKNPERYLEAVKKLVEKNQALVTSKQVAKELGENYSPVHNKLTRIAKKPKYGLQKIKVHKDRYKWKLKGQLEKQNCNKKVVEDGS